MNDSPSHYRSKTIAILSYLTLLSILFVTFRAIQIPTHAAPDWMFPLFGWLASGFAFYYLTALIEVPPTHENRGVWRELSLRIFVSCLLAICMVAVNLKIAQMYYQESVYIYAFLFLLVTIPSYALIFWHASKASEAIKLLRKSDNKGFNQTPEFSGPAKQGELSGGAR